jgi:hypothetical protein
MISLDNIRSLGYDAEELAPRVFCISNFARPDQVRELLEEAAAYTQEEWNYHYLNEMRKNCLAKFGRDDIENLKKEGLIEVTASWEDKNIIVKNQAVVTDLNDRSKQIFSEVEDLGVTGFYTFQRLYEGTELVAHFDKYSDKLVEYAAVLYLNDDYTEGELFFPKLGLDKIRPTPGDLLVFPGTAEFEHGVHPVGPGPVRYVIPTFIKTRHPDGAMAGWGDFG